MDVEAVETDVLALIEGNKGKKVTRHQAARKARAHKTAKAAKGGRKGKWKTETRQKRRSTKEILEFCQTEATPENAKKYGRKVPQALKAITGLASGASAATVLRNLGAL